MSQPETDSVYLSLIIPAFNEETRTGKSLEQILRFLKSQPYSFEMIVSIRMNHCLGRYR
jgi:hypothetical protein